MRRVAAVVLVAASTAAAARDAPDPRPNIQPNIWAVRGLYGLERGTCTPVTDAGPGWDGAMIDPVLCPQLDMAHRVAIGERFAAAMARAFPGVEANFAERLPAGATVRAKLAHSLIASLRLTRATIWRVAKPRGVDAYLPITLTLDITNAATGEVVFTRTRSDIAQGIFPADAIDAAMVAQFDARLAATLDALVADAARAWRPWAQQATVVGEKDGSWIIDKGRRHGLRSGDAIGDDGTITYAAAEYAVVKPTLGRYRTGEVLTRRAVAPVEQLAKPSVLTMMGALPDGYAAPYLSQIFQDALGTRGAFAPLPISPGFSNLRSTALGAVRAPSALPRSLPDYVASVSVVALPSARYASNVPGIRIERHEARAFVSLVDRTGRVVASFQGTGRIQDDVAGDMGFSAEQRRDTVVRNALIEAATAMTGFKAQPLDLPVIARHGAMIVRDGGGVLPAGVQLTVLRDIGRMPGIAGPVRVPAGMVTTGDVLAEGVAATDSGEIPLQLKGGETVAIDRAGPPILSRRAVAQCADADGRPRVDDRGKLAVHGWTTTGAAGFATGYDGPMLVANLPARLAALNAEFAGWERYAPARPRTPDACFVPVIAVAPTAAGYDLTVGYTLMQGATKLAGQGMRAVLTPTRLPDGTTADAIAAMVQQDLAAQLPALTARAASMLRTQP